jgi:hypothetical protein
LDKASTTEIKNYLEEISRQNNEDIIKEAQKKYENGDFTDIEREDHIKKKSIETIDIRTIQRCVKELTEKKGLLEKKMVDIIYRQKPH